MTTDPPEHEEAERVFTERELAKQEDTLAELRQRLAELRTRDGELEAEIADRMAEEADVSDLRERRTEIRDTLEELEGIPSILEARIADRRHRARREQARERLGAIKKKVGGLVGEAPRRAEKARELAEKLADQLEWLSHAKMRRMLFKKEARALASAYGLEAPELKSFEVDTSKARGAAKRTIRTVSTPPESLALGDNRKAARILERVYDEETPTPGLLDALEDAESA